MEPESLVGVQGSADERINMSHLSTPDSFIFIFSPDAFLVPVLRSSWPSFQGCITRWQHATFLFLKPLLPRIVDSSKKKRK